MKTLTKTDWAWVLGLMALALTLCLFMLNPYLTLVNHDSAIFSILAQSILNGNYLLVSEPTSQPYFTFPPLLSLQLAGLMLLFQNSDPLQMQMIFKGYIHLLFVASIPIYYLWLRQYFPEDNPWPARGLTLLLALTAIMYKYTSGVLSDVPYWTFSIAALYSLWQKKFVPSLILVVCCALTRQIGLALVLAMLISLASEKQWKQLAISVVVFALTVGGWQSYEHFYRSSHRSEVDSLNQAGVQQVLDKSPIKLEYVKHFLIDNPVQQDESASQLNPSILLQNAGVRLKTYGEYLMNQLLPPLRVKLNGDKQNIWHWPILLLLLGATWITGFVQTGRKFPVLGWYVGLYFGVLLLYPYLSVRFILPVLPFLFLNLYEGASALMPGQPIRRAVLPILLGVVLIGGQLPQTIRYVSHEYKIKKAHVGPSTKASNRAYYESLLWVKANTPKDSLLITRKPPVAYLYSDRKATAFPFTHHTDKLMHFVQTQHQHFAKTYLVEDQAFEESTKYLKPLVERYHQALKLVYEDPQSKTRVWQIK